MHNRWACDPTIACVSRRADALASPASPATPGRAAAGAGAGDARRRGSWPVFIGAAVGAITFAVYTAGSNRGLSWDSAVTVSLFITRGNAIYPFLHQHVYTNHPLFSFLEHVVFDITGSRSELVLRVLPITFGALTVALVAGWTTRRLGVCAGCAAGAIVALNPSFAFEATEVRGYSLFVLAAVASTIVLVGDPAGWSLRNRRVLYGLLVAVGIGAHLAMLAVVAVHLGVLVVDRARRAQLLTPFLVGSAVGLSTYAGLVSQMARTTHREFHLRFVSDLWREMLGGTLLTARLLTIVLLVGLWATRRRAVLIVPAAVLTVLMITAWLLAPQNFFPRFFLWLVPLAAVAIAAGVRRVPWLVVLVAIALVPQARDVYRLLSKDEFANRAGAAVLLSEARHGRRVCATGPDSQTLLGSLSRDDFHVIRTAGSLSDCQVVVVVSPARHRNLIASARKAFPHCVVLPARLHPGYVLSRRPLAQRPPINSTQCPTTPGGSDR